MCTVSYIPVQEGFYFTSSRDELSIRESLEPKFYDIENEKLLFPKDMKAGGTWIATSIKGITICLLNGAFEKHIKSEKNYRSRGQVVLECFRFKDIHNLNNNIDLSEVEPFTLLILDYRNKEQLQLNELIWDGNNKHFKKLDSSCPYLWCSATLYEKIEQKLRKLKFADFLSKKEFSSKEIIDFHNLNFNYMNTSSGKSELEITLMTLNISQIFVKNDVTDIKYKDMLNDRSYRFYIHKNQSLNA